MNRAFVRASALTSLVLAVGCMQDFDQFRGGGGAGTGGSGGIVDPCDGIDCDDDNRCTQDSCVDGVCQNVPGTATFPDPGDDCVDTICEEGVERTVPDDNETPPSDGNECTADTCSAGAPVYTPTPGQPCGDGSVCNAAGQCSCNVASDCGTNPDCGTWSCEPTGCLLTLAPSDTTTPKEDNGTVGDCLALFCDDDPDGNLEELPSADLPVDGNQCTLNVCTDGTPSNPNAPNGTSCTANGATPCPGCQCTAGECCTTQAQACGSRQCGMVPDSCGNMENCGTCSNPALPACTTAGQCVECTTNANCAAPEPRCALSGANVNTCVQCLVMADCNGVAGKPQCATTGANANSCVECLTNTDCNGVAGKPVCNTTTNTCVECAGDGDCTADPAKTRCSTSGATAGTCVACDVNAHCSGNIFGTECKADKTCGCNPEANNSSDCSGSSRGRDCIAGGVCGCNGASGCPGALGTCTANVCVP